MLDIPEPVLPGLAFTLRNSFSACNQEEQLPEPWSWAQLVRSEVKSLKEWGLHPLRNPMAKQDYPRLRSVVDYAKSSVTGKTQGATVLAALCLSLVQKEPVSPLSRPCPLEVDQHLQLPNFLQLRNMVLRNEVKKWRETLVYIYPKVTERACQLQDAWTLSRVLFLPAWDSDLPGTGVDQQRAVFGGRSPKGVRANGKPKDGSEPEASPRKRTWTITLQASEF